MIPEDMRKIWALGLETSAFSIKLCGAGGGGYFLGWLQEGRSLPADLSGHTILFPAF